MHFPKQSLTSKLIPLLGFGVIIRRREKDIHVASGEWHRTTAPCQRQHTTDSSEPKQRKAEFEDLKTKIKST